jgi:hypothetical protein
MWNLQRLTWRLSQNNWARLFLLLGTFPPVGTLIRGTAVRNEPWFNESLFGTEDSELWTRLALRGCQMHLSMRKGGCYRIRQASISTDIEKRKTNYRKWLDCSLASTTDEALGEGFSTLVAAMIELQISNGFVGESRREQACKGVSMLANLDKTRFDSLSQHVIYSSLINNGLSDSALWLKHLGAEPPAQIAARIFHLLKSRNGMSLLCDLTKYACCAPLNTAKALLIIAGIAPAHNRMPANL